MEAGGEADEFEVDEVMSEKVDDKEEVLDPEDRDRDIPGAEGDWRCNDLGAMARTHALAGVWRTNGQRKGPDMIARILLLNVRPRVGVSGHKNNPCHAFRTHVPGD